MDLVYAPDLDEVVPRSDRSKLVPAPLDRARRDLLGISTREGSAALGPLQVRRHPVPSLHGPRRTANEDVAHLLPGELETLVVRTDTRRNVPHDLVHQRREPGTDLRLGEAGAQQPHSAVDVVPDASGTHYPALLGIERRDATDREAVAPVDV